MAGVAVGGARLGQAGSILRGTGDSHRHRAIPVYALLHSRSAALFLPSFRTVQLHHRSREPAAHTLLRHVGGAGAGPADQGTDRAGVLLCSRDPVVAAERAMAALAGP